VAGVKSLLGQKLRLLALLIGGAALIGCRDKSDRVGAATSWCSPPASLRFVGKSLGQRGRLRLGVVGDAGDAAPESRAALARFVDTFAQRKVDAVVALGNLGTSEPEMTEVLTTLTRAGAPLLVLAGESEPRAAFDAAIEKARAGGHDVVDLVGTPLVDAGGIDIVAVSGARAAANDCHHDEADLAALARAAGGRWRPLVLLAYAAPKRDQDNALDWEAGQHVGDPLVLDLINALYPNAALFASPPSAGGAIERSGWMNVGGLRNGMAAIVELKGGIAHREMLH
jgi:hypothetical protein